MSTPPTTARAGRWRSILLLAVIFASGAILGSAVTVGVQRGAMRRTADAAAWRGDILTRLDRRLDLTDEQRAKLEPVVADLSAELQVLRVRTWREWSAVLLRYRDELRAVLTPEQQKELEEISARARTRLQRAIGESQK